MPAKLASRQASSAVEDYLEANPKSALKITVVIEEKYTELAVRVLHKAFELDQA